jgi:hypothetical protein
MRWALPVIPVRIQAKKGYLLDWIPLGALSLLLETVSRFTVDPSEAAHLRYLLLWGCGTLLFLLPLFRGTLWSHLFPFAFGTLSLALPHVGVLRLAASGAVLVTAWFVGMLLAWQRQKLRWFALAASGQWLVRGDLLHTAPTALGTWVELLGAPLLVAGMLRGFEQTAKEHRTILATAGLLAFGAGNGWGLLALIALGVGLAFFDPARRASFLTPLLLPILTFLPSQEPFWVWTSALVLGVLATSFWVPIARLSLALLAGWVSLAALLTALPWKRPAPFATSLVALFPPKASPLRLIESQATTLHSESPDLHFAFENRPVRRLTLESYLVGSTALPCGTLLLEASFQGAHPATVPLLRLGENTAEWAASRPDVATALACPAPPPWSSWIPASGRYFGHHYRAELEFSPPIVASGLVLSRPSTLPKEVAISLFGLRLEP